MSNEPLDADIGNRIYQQQMAKNLVQSLGMGGAVEACYQNNWSGTLSIILKDDTPLVAIKGESA